MTTPRRIAPFGLMLTLALVACAPRPAPTPAEAPPAPPSEPAPVTPTSGLPDAPAPQTVTNPVDWEAAVQAAATTDGTVQPFAVGGEAPRVPILVPTGLALAQNDSVSFRATNDGYFAVYPGPVYDVVVNGTAEAYVAPEARMAEGDRPEMRVTGTEQGLQVALTRFGADYLVEFECKSGDATCISEEDARRVVTELVVVGGR